jgi:prevent-host-death family protein
MASILDDKGAYRRSSRLNRREPLKKRGACAMSLIRRRVRIVVNLLQHMKTIPQRELRNHISQVLRSVENGERMQITVDGRPVAELMPVGGRRRTFVPRDEVLALLRRASLDRKFERDMRAVDATIDEL